MLLGFETVPQQSRGSSIDSEFLGNVLKHLDPSGKSHQDSYRVTEEVLNTLGVLPMDVGHAGDGWLAVQGGVWPVMVVDVQPARQGFASG